MDLDLQTASGAQALDDGVTLLDRWRLLGVADTEDNSILYDAMDAETGDLVRVREYCPMLLCSRSGNALVPTKQAAFDTGLEEFSHIAGALTEIPHIPAVIAAFRDNGTCYAVTHKSEGKRLFEAAPLLTETYAQSLGVMLCETFSALHQNGVYYGTIREEDLRFLPGGKLRVGTSHLSLEGSAANDLHGLTAFLLSMLPIEREENPKALELEKLLRCSYRDADTLKAALLGGKLPKKRRPRTGTLRGIAGLALCVLFLSGAIAGVKHVLTHQQPLTRALKSGKIEPEVISVWMPMRENADEKAVVAMYQKLAAGFERQNPGCGVDIKIYADGSFEDALALVAKGAQPPTVFMDTQDTLVLDTAADLTPLTSAMRDVYLTDLSGFGNSLPLGCSIPALYYNVYNDNTFSDEVTIDYADLPAGTLYDASAAVFLESQDAAQLPSAQFDAFLENAGTPVLASSSCMAEAEHSGMTSGAVHMLPVSVDGTFPVQYEMYCSISRDVSENSRNVGMLWLQYLLTEEAQQILFVENYGDLPLHRNAFNSAVSVHSGMSSLKGVPLDSLSLQVRR